MTPYIFKNRLAASEKVYREWQNQFKPDTLYNYYEGKQWQGFSGSPSRSNPYVLNLVNTAIETKLANLLFTNPKFITAPRPGNSDWNQEAASQSAQLKEDFLNTVTANPKMDFVGELEAYLLDSHFYFGVMEVDYARDWRNPLHDTPVLNDEGTEVEEEYPVPLSESLYVKRIEPWRFRTSACGRNTLEKCDWYGYYDFVSRPILENTKGIKFPKAYATASYIPGLTPNSELTNGMGIPIQDQFAIGGGATELCKVWHIWSNQTKMRYLFLDGNFETLWEEPFENTCIVSLRWKRRKTGWLPIPPVYNWIFPQDEVNESRENMRNYRRRYKRGFGRKPSLDQTEAEKFVSGPDGIVIEMNNKEEMWPLENPALGAAVTDALIVGKDDFNIVSATGSELRGQNDRETATAAKISATRAGVRESFVQRTFGNNVGQIGRTLLLVAQQKMTLGYWIEITSDPGDQMLEEYQNNVAYKFITPDAIRDGFDVSVMIDVVNNTPAAAEEQKMAFIEFLTIVSSNPIISMSPALIREAAYRVGYRNDKVILEMQRASMLQQAAQAAGAAGATPGNANNNGKEQAMNNGANSQDEIQSQLNSQVVQ